MIAPALEKFLLVAAADDWVHFAELIFDVREQEPEIGEAAIHDRAIEVAEDLAKRGLWRAGNVTAAGFSAWSATPEEASRRMREGLRLLGRPVWPGDVCWFEVTPHGLATLRRHEEEA
jgi:hypothetical protein